VQASIADLLFVEGAIVTRRTLRTASAALGMLALASCAQDTASTAPGAVRNTGAEQVELAPAALTVAEAIRINEVESNQGTPGDWVELVNLSNEPLDISGYRLKDNDNSRPFAFPSGTIVPANGFLVVEEAQFDYGLGANDMVRLFAPDNVTIIDSYAWTAHASTTYARCPDGTGAFGTASTVTKGAANDCGAAIKINEIESSGGTPGDWIELYNPTNSVVNVSGYVVKDSDDTHVYVIPTGTTIAAQGYLVIDESSLGFGLGGEDAVRLFRANGTTLVDSYNWTAHAATTYGRCPDGTGSLVNTAASTKGTANNCAAATTAVVINEVESNGDPAGDWVEFYNTSAATVDLSGYVFRDNQDGSDHSYVIPTGTTIAPGGFLVLLESQFGYGLGTDDSARLFAPGGATLVASYSWGPHAATTYARCPDGTGEFRTSTTSTRGAANDCAVSVRINEVESNGGTPGDWVELFNAGATTVDLSGYVFRDNNNAAGYVLPSGTTIAANGYLVLEEAQFGFGLGGGDAARLFAPDGTTLIDSYVWTAHASTTYGRCVNGSGAFTTTTAPTKGAANACPGEIVYSAWPGDQTISNATPAGTVFGGNMSGLFYQPQSGMATGVVWAVRNGPGALFRLTNVGGLWTPKAARTWTNGKLLRYPDGAGDVDAEGVTAVGSNIYVSAERNNASSSVSRNSILLFDVSVETGATLVAKREWNITSSIAANGANLGLEGITRIPDAFLVARGFYDESKGRAYNPADYPNSNGGVFFVGVEGTGQIHAFALDHVSGGFTRLASFTSGFASIMDVTFDAELGQFWAVCDDTCQGRMTNLRIDTQAGSPTQGRFVVSQRFERPTGMPNLNNEGFTFAPLAECVGGKRPALWADDGETGGFSLRLGTVTCTPF